MDMFQLPEEVPPEWPDSIIQASDFLFVKRFAPALSIVACYPCLWMKGLRLGALIRRLQCVIRGQRRFNRATAIVRDWETIQHFNLIMLHSPGFLVNKNSFESFKYLQI